MRTLCSSWIFAAIIFCCAPADSRAEPFGDALDQEVYWVLKKNCTKCHDDLGDEQAAASVGDLLDLETLAIGYLDPSDEDMINDLLFGPEARMPKPEFDELPWNGPLSSGDRATLRTWVDRGGPSEEYLAAQQAPARSLITPEIASDAILSDLQTLRGVELRNARYLTLWNLHNNPEISESELDVYRAAIVKTLNSLSHSADVLGLDTSTASNRLTAVDKMRTIFRFDLRDLNWASAEWDRVANHDPFSVDTRSATDTAIANATSSGYPVLRADWFVFATLQPPLYHELLHITPTLDELERNLGLDRVGAIRQRRVARAGMIESKVSVNNRLLERIPMSGRNGAYHISYDFASNIGEQNFRDFPYGPPGTFRTDKSFEHDGGEVIFNLPNGFQAYMLIDGVGNRLDIAPQAIVQDRTMPGSVIINGISCLSCHYQGMKPERFSPRLAALDEVRAAVLDNSRRFTAAEHELTTELYPEHDVFRKLVEEDRVRFLTALKAAGIPQKGATEPARALFDQFKNDLTIERVAAEFGLSVNDLRSRMQREAETRQILAAAERGTLKRQQWLNVYGRSARLMGLGTGRTTASLPYPYFGEKVDELATNHAVDSTHNPDVGHTGIDLIDAENRDGQLKIEMWTEDERRSFAEGEPLRVRLRANHDCFVTLISIDPAGDMTLLMPNSFHGNFPIGAGQTITIPTPQMTFEFVTQPPHGRTILKAIATTRPLDIKGVTRQRLANEVVASLGRAKGFGVKKKQVAVRQPVQPQLTQLTVERLETMFDGNEWATASFSVTTRP